MTKITVLGLGEAGRLYAVGLREAGADVRGYDHFVHAAHPRIEQVEDLAEAVAGADVVLSLVGGDSALVVLGQVVGVLPPEAIYADFNTAAPELKVRLEAVAAREGIAFSDVAVLAPVPRAGHRTPLVASGDGADALSVLLAPLGVPVTSVGGRAGEAARLKLVRSVFMKGLATLVIESLGAARAVDAEPWLREQMNRELGPGGGDLVDRLLSGTYEHASRRRHEVSDALELLEATGQPADMTRGALAWFDRILAEREPPAGAGGITGGGPS